MAEVRGLAVGRWCGAAPWFRCGRPCGNCGTWCCAAGGCGDLHLLVWVDADADADGGGGGGDDDAECSRSR